ncbi:hypothetical protein LJPFL01_2708 [Lelliottia jeotgali]|nr:hypothetical protein LJPFL01_2708 [Lelliottia jeotgali]
MRKVIFLDLCGTLVKENTTFDFFNKHILPKQKLIYKLIWKFKIAQIITKSCSIMSFNFDLTKQFCLFMMKDYSLNELKQEADCYTKSLNWRYDILRKVDILRRDGYEPIVVSASLSFIVKSVCEYLKISTYYGSELAIQNGCSAGYLKLDLQGNKNDIIASVICSKSIFYTDNIDDLACKDIVNYFIAVTTTRNVAYWKDNGVRYHVV